MIAIQQADAKISNIALTQAELEIARLLLEFALSFKGRAESAIKETPDDEDDSREERWTEKEMVEAALS